MCPRRVIPFKAQLICNIGRDRARTDPRVVLARVQHVAPSVCFGLCRHPVGCVAGQIERILRGWLRACAPGRYARPVVIDRVVDIPQPPRSDPRLYQFISSVITPCPLSQVCTPVSPRRDGRYGEVNPLGKWLVKT